MPKFAGWLAVYGQGTAEADESERTERPARAAGASQAEADDEPASGVLPALAAGQALAVRDIRPDQKFTQAPPRFNEGSLVKALEENGIGRPSTYASIISVLQARDYVNKTEGRFRPTVLGRRLVDRLLHPAFDDILDIEYTARMEDKLDEIEKGRADYRETLGTFYKSFEKDLERAAREMPNFKEGQPTGQTCDKCGQGEMVEKAGKFGIFLACSRYPECDNTKRARTRRRADRGARGDLRELRAADGRQARPVRHVPGLHRVPRVQDDPEDHQHQAGRLGRQARPDARRDLPELRPQPRAEAGTLRRVHGLLGISRVQVRQAEDARACRARATAARSSSGNRAAARSSTGA